MKKFLKKTIVLFLLSAVVIGAYCKLASVATSKYYGPNTAEQIEMSFRNAVKKDYNCYFLGNSRVYRDINPDMFTSVDSYNFGHDNDSYNQMYYKLLYLLDKGMQIDYLIVGTDYFQFSFLSDTRNYVYGSLFQAGYLKDYGVAGPVSWGRWALDSLKTIWINKQNGRMACAYYLLGADVPEYLTRLKDNGQFCAYGHASGTETIDRDYAVLDIQYDYYKKIISLCEDEGIMLYVVMPPLWAGETASHTEEERAKFDEMILDSLKGTPFAGNYINYSAKEGLSSYEDFIDVTHLTLEAADRFSEYLSYELF